MQRVFRLAHNKIFYEEEEEVEERKEKKKHTENEHTLINNEKKIALIKTIQWDDKMYLIEKNVGVDTENN